MSQQIIAGIYELGTEIGSGGVGVVYLGEHMRLHKRIVLKADKRTLKTKEDSLRREVDLLKELSHSYIPQVYDFVQQDDVVYTVMDFIEGESLDRLLKDGRIPTQPQVIHWACQLLEALIYLHSRSPHGILHGDIKPANIMLRPDGDICLIDFNIALALGEDGAVKVGRSRGYASPEHYGIGGDTYRNAASRKLGRDSDETETETDFGRGTLGSISSSDSISGEKKTVLLDVRSDIYSLGATLYHLISGVKPPQNAAEVTPLGTEVCSKQISMIIQKAMAPAPEKRYQTAREMLDAFTGLHKNDIRTIRHKKRMAAGMVSLTALFLLGGAGALIGLKQMEQRQSALALSEYSANALAAGDVTEAVAKALQAIPAGNSILEGQVTAQAQKALTDALGVYELSDSFQPLDTITLPTAPFSMEVSEEENLLAAVCAYEVLVYNLQSRELMASLPAEKSALSECVFLGDKRILYAGEQGITAYDLAEEKALWSGGKATTLAVSADKTRVAAVNRDERKAYIYDTGNGKVIAECSLGEKHLSVAENDIFANPKDNLFSLNRDGSLLAVSFSDGALIVFDLENNENTMILYEESEYGHFQGGFCGKYFAFTAKQRGGSLFGMLDVSEGVFLGGVETQNDFVLQATEEGIYLAEGSAVVQLDPETMQETETAFSDTAKISQFSAVGEHVLIIGEDNSFSFYNGGADLMSVHTSEDVLDFAHLTGEYAVLGSRNSPALRLLKKNSRAEALFFKYDAGYAHEEARISGDGSTAMLFDYRGFCIYDRSGRMLAECRLPDAESIYDQQFHKEPQESYLEVIWYDGSVRCYSASDGSLLSETEKEPPDKELLEEFLTQDYRIVSSLHSPPQVYDRDTGELKAVLESESYLTYVTQLGDYLITEYINTESERFGLVLNRDFQVTACLPGLCDITEDMLIFDDKAGNLRQSRLYSLEELVLLGREYIAESEGGIEK